MELKNIHNATQISEHFVVTVMRAASGRTYNISFPSTRDAARISGISVTKHVLITSCRPNPFGAYMSQHGNMYCKPQALNRIDVCSACVIGLERCMRAFTLYIKYIHQDDPVSSRPCTKRCCNRSMTYMAVPTWLHSPLLKPKNIPALLSLQNTLVTSGRNHLHRISDIDAELIGNNDATKVAVVIHLQMADPSR